MSSWDAGTASRDPSDRVVHPSRVPRWSSRWRHSTLDPQTGPDAAFLGHRLASLLPGSKPKLPSSNQSPHIETNSNSQPNYLCTRYLHTCIPA